MSSATTRSLRNRSGRSSPAIFGEKETPFRAVSGAHDVKNGRETDTNTWSEPVVRNAVPSFEDTKGLERLGVLEHMAPLGAAPTQKLLQKLKITFNRSSPRETPVYVDDNESQPVEQPGTDAPSPVETDALSEATSVQPPAIFSTPPRGRPAKKDADEMRQATVLANGTPSPTKKNNQSNRASPKPQSIQDFLKQDRIRNSIYRAIEEAKSQSDAQLIPGFMMILDDAKSKQSLWGVLDAIVNKSPTNAQFRTFKRYIKRGIRQYQSGSPVLLSPSHADEQITPPNSDRAGFSHLPHDLDKITGANHEILAATNSDHINRVKSPHHRLQGVISPSPKPSLSTRRSHHKRPSATSAVGGSQTTSAVTDNRKRSSSASSASSLSSAKSLAEDLASANEDDGVSHPNGGRPVRSAGQRQAANRVAAVSRTRSSINNQPESTQSYSGLPASTRSIYKRFKGAKNKEATLQETLEIEEKKRKFTQDSFTNYNNIERPDSHERSAVNAIQLCEETSLSLTPPPVIHTNPLQPTTGTLFSTSQGQAEPDFLAINGTSRKRTYDEFDRDERGSLSSLSSSPAPSLPPPPPGAMRGSTPRASRLPPPPPPPNRVRKSARVMISPNKPKNGGITAGFSRLGAGKDIGAANGAESGGEENDEFCASCGGEGILLCCDGCTNSFHHACLEPPLDPDAEVEGEWFCPQCIARRNKQPLPTTGLMARVIRRVDDTIPKAYSLPYDIRDYFEGVKTGDEGEYEEVSAPRTHISAQKMNRAGFFEQPNYKESRDSKGNLITCYHCGETSNGRDIIPCDFCPAKWHTDCVNPPMAVPPRRTGGDKPNGYWRCPLHIEQDLASISREAELVPGSEGRIPRLRKPKQAMFIDVDMTRGFRNNGVIEVDLMKDEMPNIKEVALNGGIYRLPEKGIRLDFIDRVKKNWYEDHIIPEQLGSSPRIRQRLYRPGHTVLHHPSAHTVVKPKTSEYIREAQALAIAETAKANAQIRQKSFIEQSAIMSLVTLAESTGAGISADPLTDLVNQLIADAPGNVEQEIKSSERESLQRLQTLINQRLMLLEDTNIAPKESHGAGQMALEDDDLIEAAQHGAASLVNGELHEDHEDHDESSGHSGVGDNQMDVS